MSELELHTALTWLELALAVPTVIALVFVRAPYGRHARPGWGPSIPAPLGWLVMEGPAFFGFLAWYLTGQHRAALVPMITAGLWLLHYGHRTLVFPWRMRSARPMPVAVVAMGFAFNVLNGYVNGRWLSEWGARDPSWLSDPRFVAGVVLFFAGASINLAADRNLLALRRTGAYQVPSGRLFRWVSCPNYLGEIIEWAGFALLAWSLPAVAFFVYTAANLAPRAMSHHGWYRERFADYPAERRALIPFLW